MAAVRGAGPHFRHHVARLTPSAQEAFDRLVAANSKPVAARTLGISIAAIDKLAHGGSAAPDLVARVEAALAERRFA